MTSSAPKTSGWAASELRTRFVPKSRIRTGLVSMSPWLDFVLILIFFLFAESRIVLQPGVVVELPTASFSEGVAPGMVATVVALNSPDGSTEMVFFNDVPYRVDNADRMRALEVAFEEYRRANSHTSLTLYADKRISHGTMSELVQMARAAGLDRVNWGMRAIDE